MGSPILSRWRHLTNPTRSVKSLAGGAALERVGTSAVIPEHAVTHGNEAGLILVIRYRLPRVLQELATVLRALIATAARADVLSVAYAC